MLKCYVERMHTDQDAHCRSNISSLSSATIWSNAESTDMSNMSKLLHGLSQMDPDTMLSTMSSGMEDVSSLTQRAYSCAYQTKTFAMQPVLCLLTEALRSVSPG